MAVKLDVLSDRGREATRKMRFVVYEYQVGHPELQIIETPNNQPAHVDLLVCKDDELKAVVEMKVRSSKSMDWDSVLKGKPFMLDLQKLYKGRDVAVALGVPFYLWIYHVQTGKLISWQLVDKFGYIQHDKFSKLTKNSDGSKLQTATSINNPKKQNDKLIGLKLRHGKIIATGIKIPD